MIFYFPILKKASILSTDVCGWTPLHCAAVGRNVLITHRLLLYGSNAHAIDQEGNTPLHLASMHGAVVVSGLLISHGASISAQNYYGETPLQLAEKFGQYHVLDRISEFDPLVVDIDHIDSLHTFTFWEEPEEIPMYSFPENQTSLLFDFTSFKHATYSVLSPFPPLFSQHIPPENTERLDVLIGEKVYFFKSSSILFSFSFYSARDLSCPVNFQK